MRILVLLVLAGCGAKPAPTTANVAPAGARPTPARTGTSGFETVSWGDAIDGAHGGARSFEGLPAVVSFDHVGDGVTAVHVRIDTTFPTMGSCQDAWTGLRARLNARLGASQSENLAAYWTTPTAAIIAACNPGDTGGANLMVEFARPEPAAP